MYLVAMIKGEYQIKKIYAQNEIEKGEKKKYQGKTFNSIYF